jgi:hypothetical protein
MSTALNDRDAILQAASVRIINPKNASILMSASSSLFHLNAAGDVDVPAITISATLIGLEGDVTFTADGAALTSVTGKSAVVRYADMQGPAAIVTARIVAGGQTFAQSCIIGVVRDGSSGSINYTWVKYADSAAGAGLSDDPTGKAYIGLAYNKGAATESTNASDYAWSLIKGTDGQPGGKGADGSTLYTWIKYSRAANGDPLADLPDDSTMYIGLATNKTTPVESTWAGDYVWSKFRGADGVSMPGTPGARGAGQYYAGGSAWSDGVANAATPGDNVVNDVVTISNGGTYAMTKRWDGSAWNAIGAVFDGSLFVTESINGAAIRAGTLDIRGPDGTIVLKASSSLAEQTKSSPNLAARLSSWGDRAGGVGVVSGSGDGRFINGEYIYMPTGYEYSGINSNPLNIQPNAYYTVSFDAYCDGTPRVLVADLYGAGLDTAGIGVQLTNTITRYKFTERMPDFGSAPKGYLRMFAGSSGSTIIISNVKVELGVVSTSWSDNVITPGNAVSYVMPGAINNTMIGGDIFSTNWNGIVGPGGAGWLLQRSGAFYAGAVQLRGSISGGSYTSYATPSDPAQIGFYVGAEGFKLGNSNSAKYITGTADGNMYMPGFKHENGQLTLDQPIIINPAFNTKSASISSSGGTYFTAARNNPNAYMGSHAMNVTGMVPVRYVWSLDYSAPPSTFAPRLTNWSPSTSISAAVSGLVGQSFDAYLTCTAFDAGGLSVSAWTTITLEIV